MTAYYTHPTFLAHEMGPGHPECPQRLAAIHDHLSRKGLMALLDVCEPVEAPDAAILRAHSVEHLDRLVAASPTDRPYHGLDPDTTMNHHTLRASYLAAGAVVEAVDMVLTERQRNAFCAVRPPGHHAERSAPMGFCFFNNIAIAAHHALAEYGLKRILIVDFDVHHGNGTEEIFADDDRVLMVSTFEHALYPFSGDIPLGTNMVNVPLAAYSDGQAMQRAVTDHWLPAIERFRPELVLISAGFDAHREDELSHLMWSDLDYAWISQQLVQVAAQHCNGRIVSSLEGGYAIQALARSVGHHVDALLGDNYRLSVAPMMDWTDRHCRFFHRLIAPKARLYTEMITTGAILHGDLHRLLDFSEEEHPVAIQLGGSEPDALAASARQAAQWGYDEINLNCGCPSERVQRGAFGACLMREPDLVADCIKAMQDAVSLPVTVKHRVGVDDQEDYGFVRDFVGKLFQVGCRVFFVHARSAILKGLSPKENREIPPLRMAVVRQLKQDFPEAVFIANGGIQTVDQARELMTPSAQGPAVDGVMIGRAAYHDPWLLHALQAALILPASPTPLNREAILPPLQSYFETQRAKGVSARFMTRHWHGLFHGQPGARRWRREICEGTLGPQALFDQLVAEFHPQ